MNPQALVELFSAAGQPERVERCVLHMDVASLDFSQVHPFKAYSHYFVQSGTTFKGIR